MLLVVAALVALLPAVALGHGAPKAAGHGESPANHSHGADGAAPSGAADEAALDVGHARAGALGWAWPALAVLTFVAVGAVYAVRARAAAAEGPLNLLALPWLRRIMTAPAVKPAIQATMLGLTAALVFLGLADVQDGALNLATRVTWTLWWAGVIFTFVMAGRVWCVACPFGALNEWSARLGGAWRRLPPAFRNLWWATALFVLLTWADELLGVVRSPVVTAWLLTGFAALAVLVGLRYERRSFCRHLCPIGGVIGLYSMVAPIELRARDACVCRGHRDKACYRGAERSRGCPMFEFPPAMDRNNNCIFCGECVGGCAPGNVALRFRSLGRDLWATRRRALDEAYLVAVLVGLTLVVSAQMLTAWSGWMHGLAGALPAFVASRVAPSTARLLVESVVLLAGALAVAPALVAAGAAAADRLAGDGALGPRRAFVALAYVFVPTGLALHLAHNLAHLLLEGDGILAAARRAAAVWTPWAPAPGAAVGPLAEASVVSLVQAAVLMAFFVLSLVVGHRLTLRTYADRTAASRAFIPLAALSLLFTIAGLLLLLQPMGARHGT